MRHLIAKHISSLLASLNLHQMLDLVNRPAGGCVVAYHHVSSTTLKAQLELLNRWYTFVSLSEFVQRHRKGKSTIGLMAITFDDGFAKEVESGAALAIRHGWPMTFYLPTGFVSLGAQCWFEKIGPLLKAAPKGVYEVDSLSLRLNDNRSRGRARNQVVKHLFYRPSSQIQCFMEKLTESLFGSADLPLNIPIPAPISNQRVKELSQHEAISFEAHSVNHPFFSTLSPQQIRFEMEESRGEVERMSGKRVHHFCYPYGSEKAIGSQAPAIARDLFQSASTAIRGRCQPGADRAMLPRITLFEQYTPAMAGLKVAITR